ncbi:SAM-dependent methyltransferase [Sphingomonas oleivorans]|uniref:SAM-dependent methyltransferase n=1 Tax=Sphingomonas oleivorans TaxID=1735121 RepID=A0A2T5FZM6_9SPHN|nr:methyltransferase domain-containing protein [Sphingomonas oleivorans]PTQ12164.1 SAM-dependent methyltransferase [Sphingomonas oleivorans]
MNDILAGYAAAATPELIARFNALSPSELYAPVFDLLPTSPARVADIGTGIGRDAAWFAQQGHEVLAVEPVKELREAGEALHGSVNIEWLDDRLPELATAQTRDPFDLVTLCAVWQHLDDNARRVAMVNLARMTAIGGMLIMSLRHGPGASDRRVFPVLPEETIKTASRLGFDLTRRSEADSVQPDNQARGVRWTWLALSKVC